MWLVKPRLDLKANIVPSNVFFQLTPLYAVLIYKTKQKTEVWNQINSWDETPNSNVRILCIFGTGKAR